MGKKVICVLFTCAALILSGIVPVLAGTNMLARPFEIWSCDRSMVFKWAPGPNYGMSHARVYQNGELIYTIQNFHSGDVFRHDIILSQDFQNVMVIRTQDNIQHMGTSAPASYIAIEFYTRGELVKTHYITDLVRDMNRISPWLNHANWLSMARPNPLSPFQRISPIEHIREYDILRVITIERIVFDFDLRTGEILSYRYYDPPLVESDVIINIHGNEIRFYDQRPVIQNERIFVPVRDIFESLGFTVEWDASTPPAITIWNRYENFRISASIGSPQFMVATFDSDEKSFTGFVRTLDVQAAQIINGRTMVPLRALLESVGYRVDWDEATSTVFITYCPDIGTAPVNVGFR